ncbi:MAG: DUF1353 domain-containing protein [Marinomonas sp.]
MVSHPLRYEANDGEFEIIVPVGFITDLASIPSPLWWWESPHEGTLAPAILHDYLYWEQTCLKDEADAVMYLAMKEVGLSWGKRNLIYAGIRTPIALKSWYDNKAAREAGESRFFKQAYVQTLLDSTINSEATLLSLQNEASATEGMVSNYQASRGLKAACEAALNEYRRTQNSAYNKAMQSDPRFVALHASR